jgi:hypothetical protein
LHFFTKVPLPTWRKESTKVQETWKLAMPMESDPAWELVQLQQLLVQNLLVARPTQFDPVQKVLP